MLARSKSSTSSGAWNTASPRSAALRTVKVWRLTKTRLAARAFDGEGARLYGGRWNSVGIPMVYTAESVALAALEVLVHLRAPSILPAYSLISAEVPDGLVQEVEPGALPPDWNADPVPPSVQAVGDAWASGSSTLALRVPSALAPESWNVLLNPRHPEFRRVRVGTAHPFRFDARLVK